jgi:hypothetical protein
MQERLDWKWVAVRLAENNTLSPCGCFRLSKGMGIKGMEFQSHSHAVHSIAKICALSGRKQHAQPLRMLQIEQWNGQQWNEFSATFLCCSFHC